MNYPPNRDKDKVDPPDKKQDEKKVERITSSEPIRRKKPLGKQFKETFFGGDAKTAMRYVVFGVLIPAAKDAIVDAGSSGIERLVFGESRRKKNPPPSGPTGYVSYNRYAMGTRNTQPPSRIMSNRARSQHDFDEIVLSSRPEAEEVIDRLFDLTSRYGSASVADLYELVGLSSNHTDHKWGWEDVRGSGVARVRDGYLLDLPEPKPLDN